MKLTVFRWMILASLWAVVFTATSHVYYGYTSTLPAPSLFAWAAAFGIGFLCTAGLLAITLLIWDLSGRIEEIIRRKPVDPANRTRIF